MKSLIALTARCPLVALFTTAAMAAFAAPSPPRAASGPFGTRLRDQVGVNIHFTDPRPGEMRLLSQAGFGLVRMDFAWAATEKQPGVYDFSAYDRLMAALDQYHMRALLILDYANPLYDGGLPPHTDAGRAAFARWAVAAATHFRNRRVLWEMWNEPNGGFWPPHADAARYAALAVAVGKALEANAPGEAYIGPATAGIDLGFLETCFRAGALQYWAGVSVHPYRTGPPDTVTPEYRQLAALIARYAPPSKSIPILSGEWGYSVIGHKTYSNVPDEATQAADFDREVLTNAADGVPLSVWYDWHDDGPNPQDTESNFGLVHNAYRAGQDPVYARKPSYAAARTLLTLLGDFHFDQTLAVAGASDAHLLSFADGRDRRYAAWTEAATPQSATLPLPPGRYTLRDISGSGGRAVTVGKAGLSLTLTGSTQFLVQGKGPRIGP